MSELDPSFFFSSAFSEHKAERRKERKEDRSGSRICELWKLTDSGADFVICNSSSFHGQAVHQSVTWQQPADEPTYLSPLLFSRRLLSAPAFTIFDPDTVVISRVKHHHLV